MPSCSSKEFKTTTTRAYAMETTTELFSYTPIGEHYHAISPDDSVISNDMSQEKFEHLFQVRTTETLDGLIPPPIAERDIPCPDGWADRVKNILLDSDINEDRMNEKLQGALKEGARGGLSVSGLEADEDAAKVTERYIRSLFEDCYGDGMKEQRINGLPISLSSRPDFVVWDRMMLSCEGKHEKNFDLENAIHQSAGYALVHLYYWLVKRALLVKNVYGVAVAGTNCRGMDTGKQFSVVLLRLSLPNKIGGKLVLHIHTIAHHTGFLEDLWTFSRRVCRLDPEASCRRLGVFEGCPALLTMPYELLQIHSTKSSWSMIRNGTAALILRVNHLTGWNLIKQYMDADPLDFKVWDEATKQIECPFFIKSKNHLSTHNPTNMEFNLAAKKPATDLLADLRDAYKAEPITTGCGAYILMADMGIPLKESRGFQELSAPRLADKLHNLMKKVLGCQETYSIVHGDIHIGNLVYNEVSGDLRLIDYDEATKRSITRRTPRTPAQQRVHNKELLKDTNAYTKNQLINLFWVCWAHRTDLPTTFDSLRQEYDGAYRDGKQPNADMVHQIYDDLCGKLEAYNNENFLDVAISNIAENVAENFRSWNPFSPRKTRSGRVLD